MEVTHQLPASNRKDTPTHKIKYMTRTHYKFTNSSWSFHYRYAWKDIISIDAFITIHLKVDGIN